MFLLGTLILTNCLIQTFKFLHIVLRALNLSVAADAYLSRITPNGRGDTLVIHDVASCRTSFADPYSKNVFYSFNRYCEYNICSLLDYLAIFILIVIPRSSAATGTRHSNCNLSQTRSHEIPRSSAAIGSFIHVENNTIQIDDRIQFVQRPILPFFRDWQDLISYP